MMMVEFKMAIPGYFLSLTAYDSCYPGQCPGQALNQTGPRRRSLGWLPPGVGQHRDQSLTRMPRPAPPAVIDG